MLARALVASTLITLVLTAGGTASPAAQQVASGRIAFSLYGVLIVTSPDGTGQWPLTPKTAGYSAGDWSPDGSLLAVERQGDLYVLDGRGRSRARLTYTPSAWEGDPSFSPDGAKLLFESIRGGDREVWTMNADGSSARRVVDSPATDPAWSPDGRRIAWSSDREGDSEIYVANIDGSEQRRLTRSPGIDENPTWSPDGSRIAFESDRDGSPDVYTMAADGSDVRQLTTSPAIDALPDWSPDGTEIAFVSTRSGERALFVMNSAGTSQRQLTASVDHTAGPAWQPLLREPLDLSSYGPNCTIWGTPADDLLVGTPGHDVICGLAGDDRLIGGAGNDLLAAEDGNDSIVGGPGFDVVAGGTANDLVDVRDGTVDSVSGGAGSDTVLVDIGLDDTFDVEQAFDPDRKNLTRGRPVRTSSTIPTGPAEYVVDGHTRLIWGSGNYATQWIEADIGRYASVARIQLVVAQYPNGPTDHLVFGKGRNGRWRHLVSFRGETRDGQVLRFTAPRPWREIRWVRVVTRQSPSWIAWREIQAYAP